MLPPKGISFPGTGVFHSFTAPRGIWNPSREIKWRKASFLQWLWVGGEGIRGVSQGLETQGVPVRHIRVPLSLNTGSWGSNACPEPDPATSWSQCSWDIRCRGTDFLGLFFQVCFIPTIKTSLVSVVWSSSWELLQRGLVYCWRNSHAVRIWPLIPVGMNSTACNASSVPLSEAKFRVKVTSKTLKIEQVQTQKLK